MKIGFVLDDSLDKADGVQQYILTLGRWLNLIGHEVHYLVGETHRTDLPFVHSLSRNHSVRFNQNRMSIPYPADKNQIKHLLRSENFDVLHVQMPYSPMLTARIIKLAPSRTAIIGSFHIVPFSRTQSIAARLLGFYLRRNLKRFDQVIGVSKPAVKFAKKSFGVNAVYIPNTIDMALFEKGKKIPKYNDGKINIVFLGRLVERKGCAHLLKAIKLLRDKHQLFNVRVLICGKGPLDKELKQYVKNNHLGSVVHFAGFINEIDKGDYLATANLAVFPSLGGESFGIVLIEAMAAGSEVVLGGNNTGYRSVLGGKPDQLFSPANTDKFANILKHYLVNGKARKRAQNWQKQTVKQYDVNVVGKQLMLVYKAAIAKHGI